MKRTLNIVNVKNTVHYKQGLELMKNLQETKIKELRAIRRAGESASSSSSSTQQIRKSNDSLIFLELHPVYTLGRNADPKNVLFDENDSKHELVRTTRGGEVTFHGPGQIVAYPVLDLRNHEQCLHFYLRQIEQVVIDSLSSFGIPGGARHDQHTGVWVGKNKVSAIGLNASNWITCHGFSLNVRTNVLKGFDNIIPCGIPAEEAGVTCLENLLLSNKKKLDPEDEKGLNRFRVQKVIAANFMELFSYSHAKVDNVTL